jgi:hypothetical protein
MWCFRQHRACLACSWRRMIRAAEFTSTAPGVSWMLRWSKLVSQRSGRFRKLLRKAAYPGSCKLDSVALTRGVGSGTALCAERLAKTWKIRLCDHVKTTDMVSRDRFLPTLWLFAQKTFPGIWGQLIGSNIISARRPREARYRHCSFKTPIGGPHELRS